MNTTNPDRRSLKAMRINGQRDRFEFRLLVGLSFIPCLVYTALARANGRSAHVAGESVVTEALSSARAAVGYAYLA